MMVTWIECKECLNYLKPPTFFPSLSLSLSLLHRFEELGANPEKAKKPHNRPKNGAEFAEKFYKGFYSLVEDEELVAEGKSHK